jgi:hypothetical protein
MNECSIISSTCRISPPHYLHGNDEAKQDAQIKPIERRAKRSKTRTFA